MIRRFYWSITNEYSQTRTFTLEVQLLAPHSPDYYRCSSPTHEPIIYRGVHAQRQSIDYLQGALNITDRAEAERLLTEAGLTAGGAA